MYILNGFTLLRTFCGKFICLTPTGSSVVDSFIISSNSLSNGILSINVNNIGLFLITV